MKTCPKISEFIASNYCMSQKVPFFLIENHEIGTINSATEFYTVIIKGIRESRYRINLSTLYIGTGPMEQFMLQEIVKASNKNQHLKINLILDKNRGYRKSHDGHSSFSLLQAMMRNATNPQNFNLSLFQHNHLPRKPSFSSSSGLNEIFGTFHLKNYIFDDTIILSGANLSEEYFTTRFDRYIFINNDKPLCDFVQDFNQIFLDFGDRVTSERYPEESWSKINTHKENVARQFSLFLFNNFQERNVIENLGLVEAEMDAPSSSKSEPNHNKLADLSVSLKQAAVSEFKNAKSVEMISAIYQTHYKHYIDKYLEYNEKSKSGKSIVMPAFQIGLIGYKGEEKLFYDLISYLFTLDPSLEFELTFTTGYFNPSDQLLKLFSKLPTNFKLIIITAAPSANSYYKAKGPKGQVCSMYRCALMNWVKTFEKHKNVSILEFEKPHATYHGKGFWLRCLNHQNSEYLTIYGSSNYSNRSYERDLEAQFYFITKNKEKIELLEKERNELLTNCHEITYDQISNDPNTKVGLWQRLLFRAFKNYL